MIKHCFFANNCKIDRQLSDYSDLEKSLKEKSWDFKDINFVNQIHSDEVYVVDSKSKIQGRQGLKKADAIVTNQKNLVIAVVTADCGPIIIKDEENKVAAIIHAGWRGAKSGIIQNAIKEMKNLGSNIEAMTVFIGPMIHQKSYQTSQEFYDEFIADDIDNASFFKKDKMAEKFLFDLPKYIESILSFQGVFKIENVQIDTYESCELYSSYRKSTHDSSYQNLRNISVTMID